MVRTAKEAGEHVGISATTWMRNGDEEMARRSEQKSYQLHDMVDLYEGEDAKASNRLYETIISSDVGFEVPMNWRSAVKLGLAFIGFLKKLLLGFLFEGIGTRPLPSRRLFGAL